VSDHLKQQWQLSGQALQKFHSALAALHAKVAAIVPEQEQALAQDDSEEEVKYRDWDPTELRQELARLQALKKELAKRSEAMIADLNKAYFADRDALFKAYEAAFKEPKMLPCDNCKTETLHSMDYSESPPHVWCNVCGRILSFMEWSGKGDSLKAIRTRGQAKKAAIQEQLKINQRAVQMAISQVQAALN
jgi:ribosomal protein S27E